MKRLLGFFSGFPDRRFPEEIARRLSRDIEGRDSLVFVSAWPQDCARNDGDSAGMYNMFLEHGISFARHCVVDDRTEASKAAGLVRGASCVFLMGGHPGLQMKLIREKGLDTAIRGSGAAVLGVSAGAINMAKRSLDTKDSPVPYAGLGLADITVKPHFRPDDRELAAELLGISAGLPICAMEDESAILAVDGAIWHTGSIHFIHKGRISRFSQEKLKQC